MVRIAAIALTLAAAASPALAADGEKLFNAQCSLCHTATSTPLGPTVRGVAGADIAGRSDFTYSPALKAKAGTWTDANLNAYLANPAGFAPGNKMFLSVPSPEGRAAIIAYMKTLK